MFRKACEIAAEFTRPIILSRKTIGGRCSSGIGAFVVINEKGWVITADHIFQQMQSLQNGATACRDLEAARKAIENDTTTNTKEKHRRLSRIPKLPKDTTEKYSVLLPFPGNPKLVDGVGLRPIDIAVARIEPFDPSWIKIYPVFKDSTKNFHPGTSLCKLGFPFHSITPTWNNANQTFELPVGALPIPFFPIDGIFTRIVETVVASPGAYPLLQIETSTPGLRGQSGGPTFDTQATVWAIQCQTASLPLGFSPAGPGGQQEHQFLNVGIGIHPETIFGFLNDRGINYKVSTY